MSGCEHVFETMDLRGAAFVNPGWSDSGYDFSLCPRCGALCLTAWRGNRWVQTIYLPAERTEGQ